METDASVAPRLSGPGTRSRPWRRRQKNQPIKVRAAATATADRQYVVRKPRAASPGISPAKNHFSWACALEVPQNKTSIDPIAASKRRR